ncbi:MAG: hypothetical protein ABJB22_06065 [Verrucomicrobiota bacterium]
MSKDGAILQIVPRAPGGRDGVGDYARTLAGELKKTHGLETTFVSAAPSDAAKTEEGYRLLSPLRAVARGQWLENHTAIVLHYVNYGYGRRGVPLWLAPVLRRLRRSGGARLVTIFHELYASGSWRQSAFWLRPVQKGIARSIAEMSAVSIVSSEFFSEQLRIMAPTTRILVHPVVSNLGEPALSSAEIADRDPHRWIICGGTELIERSLRSFLSATGSIDEPFAPRELFLVGGAENSRVRRALSEQTKVHTHYHPDVDARIASGFLAGCAFGWIDYFHRPDVPMPAILKSSAFAAYCAHGVVPVFPHDGSPVALRGDALPGPFFVGPSGHNLPMEAERATAGQSIHSWYGRNASAVHLAKAVAAALGRPA